MTIDIQVANDTVVSVRLVKGKPVADIDALRKYHRDFYHANKKDRECEHCTCKFTSQSAFVRHQRRNQKCALLRAKAELEMLRSGQAEVHGLWRAVQERIAQRGPLQRTLETEATSAAAERLEEESKCDRCGSQDGVIGGGANDYFINLCKCCFKQIPPSDAFLRGLTHLDDGVNQSEDEDAAGSKNI